MTISSHLTKFVIFFFIKYSFLSYEISFDAQKVHNHAELFHLLLSGHLLIVLVSVNQPSICKDLSAFMRFQVFEMLRLLLLNRFRGF